MRAAIYARVSRKKDKDKSTGEQTPAEERTDDREEALSVPRQVRGARTFIEKRGWTLDERHVYEDDGVSGALFANRAEFQRMLQDAESRAFDAIVFFDLDRFGRNAQKTMTALQDLIDLDVSVWDYSTGQSVDLETFEGEMVTFLKARFAQQYRDSIRKHTREAMRQKWLAGFVVGSRIFGYTNVGDKGKRRRVVNPTEAAVIIEVFERYARGEGYRQIAWALNARKVPSPRGQRGRPSGWEPSTVRGLLTQPLYRGEDYYGRSAKAYGRELGRKSTREKGQLRKAKETWLRRECPELRIVDPILADAVDARRDSRNSRYLRSMNGQLIGRPANGAKHLLSGWLTCPCGARFEALKGGNWKYRGAVYVCAARRRKGPSVCPHNFAFPIEATDTMILDVIEGTVLAPSFVQQVLDTAYVEADDRSALLEERAQLTREIENLTTAIAAGGDIPALVTMLQERDKRLKRLDLRLSAESPDREALRSALEQRVADWRAILRGNKKQARMVLQQLVGPIQLEGAEPPNWMAQPRPEGLLVGVVPRVASPGRSATDVSVPWVASPNGTAPQWYIDFRRQFRAA